MDKKTIIKQLVNLKNTKLNSQDVINLIYSELLNNETSNKVLDYYDVMSKYFRFDGENYTAQQFVEAYGNICKQIYTSQFSDAKEISDEELLNIPSVNEEDLNSVKQVIADFAESFVEIYNSNILSEKSINECFNRQKNSNMWDVLSRQGLDNSELSADVFAEVATNSYMEQYVIDSLNNMSDIIIRSFNDFNYGDCVRSLYNVGKKINYDRYYDIVSTADVLRQKSGYMWKVVRFLQSALADKIKSGISQDYDDMMDVNNKEFNKFAKSFGRRFRPKDIEYVSEKMMEYFVETYYFDGMDHDFIDNFTNKLIHGDELKYDFNSLYNAQTFNSENISMERIVSKLCASIPGYLQERSNRQRVNEFIANESNIFSYLRSKSGDLINEQLFKKQNSQSKDQRFHVQSLIESVDEDKKKEFETIVLQYVQDKFDKMDGKKLARGILSEEFIREYNRDLIKIAVNSKYDDKSAVNIIKDIMKADIVEDVFDNEDFDM